MPTPPMSPEELELDEGALAHARAAPSRAEELASRTPSPAPRNGAKVVGLLALVLALVGGGVVTALALASSRVERRAPSRRSPDAELVTAGDDGAATKLWAPTLTPSEESLALQPGEAGEVPMLLLDSSPSGARVVAGGHELGVTPLAIETPAADGEELLVELRAPGRAPWRARLAGGRSHSLHAKLPAKQ